ncbi:MAG: TIGR02679 domain-containing protein [Ktedonobacteraceae bacterium]
MLDDRDLAPNVQKAVAFFMHVGLTRLLERMREKYIEVGDVGGQIVIEDSTATERRELASFLGKAPYKGDTIKVGLSEVDATLRRSGFSCTLPDVLHAFLPDQPLVTRKERRVAHATHQTNFRAALQVLVLQVAEGTRGYLWLTQGQHGAEWLYSRCKNVSKEEQQQQLRMVQLVAHALNELPAPEKPERLALFAHRVSGNPHALDADTGTGRLFLLALSDLAHNRENARKDEVEHEELATRPSQDRIQELRLYAAVGLRVDTISSNVAVFHLVEAIDHEGHIDALPHVAGERVLLLPLRQIVGWQSVVPAKHHIYVCENPQVFEEIVEQQRGEGISPTLVCTSGWPSVAALMLLDMLLAQSPDNTLYYSGDFDLKGLQIATYLIARYPERCHLWRFDSDAYAVALQYGGVAASPNELAMLNVLPPVFAALVSTMQARGMWAYQEGITQLLAMDIYEE